MADQLSDGGSFRVLPASRLDYRTMQSLEGGLRLRKPGLPDGAQGGSRSAVTGGTEGDKDFLHQGLPDSS